MKICEKCGILYRAVKEGNRCTMKNCDGKLVLVKIVVDSDNHDVTIDTDQDDSPDPA